MAGGNRFEQGCAQHRRQNQCHNHRQEHGNDDRYGELAVNDTGRTGEKGHGGENSREHQPDADERAGNLLHRLGRGLAGRKPLLRHDPLNVFHNYNSIIHQKADGQDHGKHGKHINRVAEEAQRGECSQNDNRHRNGRNQRGPHVAQKKPHDQKNQQDGFKKGLYYFVYGYPDKWCCVERVVNLHPRREKAAQFFHLCLDGVGCIQRIGARGLPDGDARRRHAVECRFDVIKFGSQLRPSDIADADGRAGGRDADRNVGKLFRSFEHILNGNGRIQLLVFHCRCAAELSCGNLGIVGLNCRDNLSYR
ncbi:MAG: hypothetical protein BWY69_01424 [Planctomycetes bacterium ADurb.Bin401]|nr:MAG: hypothetical protein BWY69_01424 [Planctomycetes bacterium ADurb.Bin401]